MLDTIHTYIEKYQLLTQDKSILIGLSGGADSVALLAVLVRLGYSCIALHCNFHLRGEESDRDEEFARLCALQMHVPFHKIDFCTTEYAAKNHLSIEMAARELRYQWFEQMRFQLNAQAIAVAHHSDDSIETLLMNLLRGSGIRGLVGIRPRNGFVVRPLLCVSKKEIITWLKEQRLQYVTDSSNLSDEYTRNFIRLRVLPLLEEVNPAARQTLSRSAAHLAAVENIYLSVIERARQELWEEQTINITALLKYPSPETILYELLSPYGFSRQVIASLFESLSGASGKCFYSQEYRLIKDRSRLLLCKRKEYPLIAVYSFRKVNQDTEQPLPLSFRIVPYDKSFQLIPSKSIAYLDYDLLADKLILRHWQEADWFIPFGMKGRKKLSDYFSDHKYSLKQKEEAWLLCSGEDIVWLVGERSDNRFRISTNTKQVLQISLNITGKHA